MLGELGVYVTTIGISRCTSWNIMLRVILAIVVLKPPRPSSHARIAMPKKKKNRPHTPLPMPKKKVDEFQNLQLTEAAARLVDATLTEADQRAMLDGVVARRNQCESQIASDDRELGRRLSLFAYAYAGTSNAGTGTPLDLVLARSEEQHEFARGRQCHLHQVHSDVEDALVSAVTQIETRQQKMLFCALRATDELHTKSMQQLVEQNDLIAALTKRITALENEAPSRNDHNFLLNRIIQLERTIRRDDDSHHPAAPRVPPNIDRPGHSTTHHRQHSRGASTPLDVGSQPVVLHEQDVRAILTRHRSASRDRLDRALLAHDIPGAIAGAQVLAAFDRGTILEVHSGGVGFGLPTGGLHPCDF